MNEAYKHIVIEGNIGAGKTTCARMLSEQLDARLVLEAFENNPFLELFYADRTRYALQVELFFLAERYQQLSKHLLGDIFQEHTVYDYHFAKSAIFSKINLNGDEQMLFNNLYQIMERFVPKPDIIVYLHHSTDRLKAQISKRGRHYEHQIPEDYLTALNHQYMSAFKEMHQFPVVILDSEQIQDPTPENVLWHINEVLSKEWPKGLSQTAF